VKTDDRVFAIDTIVASRTSQQGWPHLHPNGTAAAFAAAQPFALSRCTIPVDTGVFQDDRATSKSEVTLVVVPADPRACKLPSTPVVR
jgi:hypothetical protein